MGLAAASPGRFSVSWLSYWGFATKAICRRKGRSGATRGPDRLGAAKAWAAPYLLGHLVSHFIDSSVFRELRENRPLMIREEPKPRMNLKLLGNLKHYDGTERPDTWIEDYYNAVTFAGGTPNIACRMLQLYLLGPAWIWLNDLEKNSIFCWFNLKNAIEKHFRGTYKRPSTTSDLQACIQKKGETSRSFLTRWLATRNECENFDNTTAMHSFIGGL
ncbi:hypothetical protein QYE76_035786 [Lolium multiflorum]|uniref:Retrotransposon gag domain-containing protein n=1 Tax=Lolium multiflorum TaxID=4521 RepID=A0AAD8QZV7_LOLMU|nr:hypothetical protein QYE76_035786 [Lolium multiflorum]